jgi:hypothetical protein
MVRAPFERLALLSMMVVLATAAAVQVVGVARTGAKETTPIDTAQRYGSWIPFWHERLAENRLAPSPFRSKPTIAIDTVRLMETSTRAAGVRLEPLAATQPCSSPVGSSPAAPKTVNLALPNDGSLITGPVVVIRSENQSNITEIQRLVRCGDEQVAQGNVVTTSLRDTHGFVGGRSNGSSWLAGSINVSDAFSGLRISHRIAITASPNLGVTLWDQLEFAPGTNLQLSTPLGRSVASTLERYGASVVELRASDSELGFTFSGTAEDFGIGDPLCISCPERKDLEAIALALKRSPSKTRQIIPTLAIGDSFFSPRLRTNEILSAVRFKLGEQTVPIEFPSGLPVDSALSLDQFFSFGSKCLEFSEIGFCIEADELKKQIEAFGSGDLALIILSPADILTSYMESDTTSVDSSTRSESLLTKLVAEIVSSAPNASIVLISPLSGSIGGNVENDRIHRIFDNVIAADPSGRVFRNAGGDSQTSGYVQSTNQTEDELLSVSVLSLVGRIRSLFESPNPLRKL